MSLLTELDNLCQFGLLSGSLRLLSPKSFLDISEDDCQQSMPDLT